MRLNSEQFGRELASIVKAALQPVQAECAALKAQNAALLSRLDSLEQRAKTATVVGGMVDRSGVLVFSLSDGSCKSVGSIIADAPARAELEALIASLVDEKIAELPRPKDGKDADPAEIRRAVAEAVRDALEDLPPPKDGATIEELAPLIASLVDEKVAELPQPKDGKDADPAEIRAAVTSDLKSLVASLVDEKVAELPRPKDGKDADPAEIRRAVSEAVKDALEDLPDTAEIEALIAAQVDEKVAALPRPKDAPTAVELMPLLASMVDECVAGTVKTAIDGLPEPEPAVGLAEALIDREGRLVLTLTDGKVMTLGVVTGKDVEPAQVRELVAGAVKEAVASLPKPRDGVDGFGFDDIHVDYDGERRVTLRFARGDRVKEFPVVLPIPIDRGVWQSGVTYAAGDCVTRSGSYWIAQRDTTATPGGHDDWRLAVKKGRDGKDASRTREGAL